MRKLSKKTRDKLTVEMWKPSFGWFLVFLGLALLGVLQVCSWIADLIYKLQIIWS